MKLPSDTGRLPLGIRLLAALAKEPAWSTMTADDLVAFRDAENRKRMSRVARVITGLPDRGAVIQWQEIAVPGRGLRVRVYRPTAAAQYIDLPLLLHVHGGGFVGTAMQCDWVNSHLATHLPAVVVSVEHRIVPTFDPMADHGRRYAERLQEAGTPIRLSEFPGATHAFLSMPGVVPQARPARAEILEFLQSHLTD